MSTDSTTSTSGTFQIVKADPPIPDCRPRSNPYDTLVEEVMEMAPDAVTVPMTRDQAKTFRKSLPGRGVILETSHRKGMMTIRYIGTTTRRI